MALLKAAAQASAAIALGGVVARVISDEYLAGAIAGPPGKSAAHGALVMPVYADRMSVRELADIVAFLQSSYAVREFHPKYGYYYN